MRDRNTGSLWSPMTGECLSGPLLGHVLKFYPSYQLRWQRWKELHEKTTVVLPEQEWASNYPDYKTTGNPKYGSLMLDSLVAPLDTRLPPYELVLGVRSGAATRAYPLNALRTQKVVEDYLNGQPIVVFYDGPSNSAAAYYRTLGAQVLDFRPSSEYQEAFIDSIYHSVWNFEGVAVLGPMRKQVLQPADFTLSYWYGWAAQYPTTDIYAR